MALTVTQASSPTIAQIRNADGSQVTGTPINLDAQIEASRAGNAGLSVNQMVSPYAREEADPGVAARAAAASAARAAAAAEAQRIANVRNAAALGQDNAVSTGNSSVNSYGDSYRLQNQGIVNGFRNATTNYNQGRENAALNLRRGIAGVTAGVRQGLQGAMAGLPDSALDSGASDALGRSWNKFGQQQASSIYNENALTNRDLDQTYQQAQFERDQAIGNLGVDRNSKVDAISTQLYNDLRTLEASAQAQGVNGVVNYGLRDNLINNAIAKLNALDQERSNELGGIQALGADQVTANAIGLDQAGAQVYDPYTLPGFEQAAADEATPVSNIPFYTRRRDI